jgi:hypothetical protein
LFAARRVRLLLLALSSAPALIAAAASVVTVVALSGVTLLLIALTLVPAAHCLWIVLLLWSAGIARSICWRSSGRKT